MNQKIFFDKNSKFQLPDILKQIEAKKTLFVHGNSWNHLPIRGIFETLKVQQVHFSDFTPNPSYEEVTKGVSLFNREHCDSIVAIGGGSAIDVAKCIKLYCHMNPAQNYLEQEYKNSGIPLIVLPTTAGTGSESTRYAVIYYEGKKQSITHESIIPNYVILNASVLKTLPLYQKKCTLLDALCQGIESWWSVNSTDESKKYSKFAVETIMQHKNAYLNNDADEVAEEIMLASNYAGRAINITQTTAPHAMSYKLTSLYNLPHGYAAAICLPKVWKYMLNHLDKCIDKRGSIYLTKVFADIALAMRCDHIETAIEEFENMLLSFKQSTPSSQNREINLEILVQAVNPLRLKNNPVALDSNAIRNIYEGIIL